MLLFSSDTPFFQYLPDELILHIVSFLPRIKQLQLGAVNRDFYRIYQDDRYWLILYQQEFGPTNFKTDVKNQYIAAYFYRQASQSRPDIAQLFFRKLHNFLLLHITKKWTRFYFGVMNYRGLGIAKNVNNGINQLKTSLSKGDFKSALEIANLYIRSQRFTFTLKDNEKELLFTLLKQAADQGYLLVARTIADLYANGIGTEQNIKTAETWLLRAIASQQPDAIADLLRLKFIPDKCKSIPKKNISLANDYLTALSKQYFADVIQAEINFQLGRLVPKKSDRLYYWNLASMAGHAEATLQITAITDMGEQRNSRLKKSYEQGNTRALLLLFELTDTEENFVMDYLPYFQEQFKNNITAFSLVDKMGTYYFNLNNQNNNPLYIWWLQISAQGGYHLAFKKLQSISAIASTPYADYALGIIHTFGMLHSTMKPDETMAEKYFIKAQEHGTTYLDKYIQMGMQEEIITKEVQQTLAASQTLNKHPTM